MGPLDDLLATIAAVHAAALDGDLWPEALAGVTRVVGGVGATLEIIDKPSLRPREFHQFGLPPASDAPYLEHYARLSPRIAFVSRQRAGESTSDYNALDEYAMDHSPFYMEFLAGFGLRYFVGGVLANSDTEFSAITVQRSPGQGHVDRPGTAVMERLMPHLRQALDVAGRLRAATCAVRSLEHALDRLVDGAALVRPNGTVVYANDAFKTIASRGEGIMLVGGAIDFATSEVRTRFALALSAAMHLNLGEPNAHSATDFAMSRPTGSPPYIVSVRWLSQEAPCDPKHGEVSFLVLVHDPLDAQQSGATEILAEIFGLTPAETHLAQALLAGVSVAKYAPARRVSLNTAYTHLRRLKDKTGSHKMTELIRRLNDVRVSFRS
jgi:DNA-binding CsgD family transcriptional regulator